MNPNICPSCGEQADPSANHCPQCGTRMRGRAADTDFLGNRLRQRTAGRYRIGRRLGSGGMAAVYEATDSLDRRWAIKVLSDMLLGQADMVDRFEREARTVLRLRHPNIVQLHAFEPHEDLHFLVLEFVEGESLADRIQRGERIPLDTALEWFRQLAHALDYAHGQQVVHRDIKPDNVLIRKTGEAVITDFGIAKVLGAATGLTRTGTTVGTGYYMSPEQWVGGELTAAADQYSLGVVLFEALSGSRPFHGESLTALMTAHLSDEPPDLVELRSDVPLPVCQVIARMLAKEPEDRFSRLADALVAAGLATADEVEIRRTPVRPPEPGTDLIDVDDEPEPESDEEEPAEAAPFGVDPLDPDPRRPDPVDAEFAGPSPGSPSATEVVSSPPPEERAASRRAEPPAVTPPLPAVDPPEVERDRPRVSEDPPHPRDDRTMDPVPSVGDGSEDGWAGRRGWLAGAGALVVLLLVWGIASMGGSDGPVAGLVLSADSLSLGGPGEEQIVQLDGRDPDGGVVALQAAEWSSENPAVASVSPAGPSDVRIAGVGAGGTWILAKAEGFETRLWVQVAGQERVAGGGGSDSTDTGGGGGVGGGGGEGEGGGSDSTPNPPVRVALSVEGSLDLEVGERSTVRAVAPPGNRIEWVVDDPSLAEVSGEGSEVSVVARAPGRTTLRARVGDVEDSAPLVVAAEAVAAVAVEPGTLELAPNDRSTLRATVRGVRSPVLDRPVVWVSRSPGVASVSDQGVVQSGADGRAWIVASAGGASDSVQVVVLAATSVVATSVGFVATDGMVRMAADFRVEPRATPVCVEGAVRFDEGDWVPLGRRTVQAGPGAARGSFERTFEDLGLPTVGNARRRVEPRARIWTGACDGLAGGEPAQEMSSAPVCLVRYLARDWAIEDCG